MNPRIAKDIRLIQLPLITGIVLMLGGFLMAPSMGTFIWMTACAIVVATVYVGDMTPNGLSLAMTLPVSRRQLWREKTTVAAVALALVSLVYLASNYARSFGVVTPLIDVLLVISLPVFFLGAGAMIALWTRQAIATFWLLMLVAGVLFIVSAVFVPWVFPGLNMFYVLCAFFLATGFLGLRVAGQNFVEYEDRGDDSALGHIELGSFLRGSADRRGRSSAGRRLLVLAFKEIVLQQINIVLTVGVIVVMGVVALTVPIEILMQIVWIPKLISLLIAFIVGAVAFAEEERMGISPWMLTFPAKRRTQFIVKLTVSVVFALLLAAVSMMAMDAFTAVHAISNQFTAVYDLRFSHIILLTLVAPLVACLCGAFTSSYSRSFLAALSHTLLTGMALYGLYYAFTTWLVLSPENQHRVAPDALMLITSVPALLTLFTLVSWKNFVRESARSKAVSSYVALGFVVLLLMVVNTSIFKRSWELREPSPRGGQFANAPAASQLLSKPLVTGIGTYAISRDGSLWRTRDIGVNLNHRVINHEPMRIGSDSDWVSAVARRNGVFALKSDGSLWMQGDFLHRNLRFKPEETGREWWDNFGYKLVEVSNLTNIAPETRWKMLAPGYWFGETFAIRDDGTLWMWGQPGATNVFSVQIDGAVQMTQCSSDTDWKDVVGRFAIKQDGSLWILDGQFQEVLGVQKRPVEWKPLQIEGLGSFTDLVYADGTRPIGRRANGDAVVLGSPYFGGEPTIGCRDAQGVTISRLPQWSDNPWYLDRDFVLTSDDVVLSRNPQLDFGCAWVAMDPYCGFTRDGSYWRFYPEEWGAHTRRDQVAEWLHLRLDTRQVSRLIPPRWRPKLVGKLEEL